MITQVGMPKQSWSRAGYRAVNVGHMVPPYPFLGAFDWIAFSHRPTYSGPFACRWCRMPVDYIAYELTFVENSLYHLLEEHDEPCAMIRKIVMGGRT